MVKLSSARESRAYGPGSARNRWEYINAGLYVFAAVLLVAGFMGQLSKHEEKSGLALLLIAVGIIAVVNAHDLVAHLAGVDYCLALAGLDAQLGLVEFAAPLVHWVGSILLFVGILFLFIQKEKGYNYILEKHALNMLVAGPVFWLVGSIHDACQIYERADGLIQILQKGVQIPFLLGSVLFLIGGIFNTHDIFGSIHHHGFKGRTWVWLSLIGSVLFVVGGLMNIMKVFKMQQMDGRRLEKLRGGAQERLSQEREGRLPLILEDNRSRNPREETKRPVTVPTSTPTPYKDVLLSNP